MKEFAPIICEAGERGIGSGLERTARWKNNTLAGQNGNTSANNAAPLEGNAANAAQVAKSTAKQVRTML